jgi:hypothetical protein
VPPGTTSIAIPPTAAAGPRIAFVVARERRVRRVRLGGVERRPIERFLAARVHDRGCREAMALAPSRRQRHCALATCDALSAAAPLGRSIDPLEMPMLLRTSAPSRLEQTPNRSRLRSLRSPRAISMSHIFAASYAAWSGPSPDRKSN